MNKGLLFSVFGALFANILLAQTPQITSTNQIPAIGDTITYSNAFSFGFDPAGSGGAVNVLWDYQTLSSTSFISFWYDDPVATPEAANFPGATVALGSDQVVNGYEYFSTTANTISRLGYSDPAVASIYYSSGWDRYQFPIDPGAYNNQTYTGDMTPLGAGEDSVTIDNGNYQAVGDAYGTLKLPPTVFGGPAEVFEDVIRVHVIETFQIKAWLLGTPAIIINVSDDYYFYFSDQVQEPLLIYGVTTDDAGGSPQTVLRYQAIPGTGSTTSLLEEGTATLEVFPNPASDRILVESSNIECPSTLMISNLLGEIVYEEYVTTGFNRKEINIADLSQGIYNVTITNASTTVSRKIVVR